MSCLQYRSAVVDAFDMKLPQVLAIFRRIGSVRHAHFECEDDRILNQALSIRLGYLHFHLILINLPEVEDGWSDREVLLRAQRAFPTRFAEMGVRGVPTEEQMKKLLKDVRLIKAMRRRLSDISWMLPPRISVARVAVRRK